MTAPETGPPTPAGDAPLAPSPALAAASASASARRGWRLAFALPAAVLSALAAVAFIAAAGAGWAVGSERGTAWLVTHLPLLQVNAPKGALIGDFSAQRVVATLPANRGSVAITDLAWRGLRIERGSGAPWAHVVIDELRANRVDVQLTPDPTAQPLAAPSGLRLPVALDLRALHVAELHFTPLGDTPLRALQAQLHLGADSGRIHRLDRLSVAWGRLQATGEATVASDAPMTLKAALNVLQSAAPDAAPNATPAVPAWRAQATLAGPLESLQLLATVRAQPSATRAAQALDARATLRPFAAWPLASLQASTTALDLAAFSSAAPATALSGSAVATRTDANAAVRVQVALNNALPGRWNEGRLPLRSVAFDVSARPDNITEIALRNLRVELGNAQAGAGRVTGTGQWHAPRWSLDAQLVGVQPAGLDARAPLMQLDGRLALAGGDFSSPPASTVEIQADLTGRLGQERGARSAQLKLDASMRPQRIEVREAVALAGLARATLAGVATQAAADAPWAVRAKGAVAEFDPAVWWPGRDDSPWRRAPTRLNATLTTELTLPANLAQRAPAALLAAVRGQASAVLAPSVLVGVPVAGEASLRSDGTPARAVLQLDAGGNRLQALGRIAAAGTGSGMGNGMGAAESDRWELTLAAPTLARLAPLYGLFLPAGSDATLAGSLQADATLSGRWPAVTTQGTLSASALRVGDLSVQQAAGRWQLGSSANAAVDAQLALTQLASGRGGATRALVEAAQLKLQGSGRAHQLSVRAESRALPPAWTDALQAPGAASGAAVNAPAGSARTVATLEAQGGLVDAAGASSAGWRGSLQQLEVRSGSGGANTSAPLLRTRDVGIELGWDGGAARAILQPGRAELLGGALRWSRVAWQAATTAGGVAQIDVQAELEPMRIAPLLARAQPDFGWGGDLAVAGRLTVRSSPTFSVDIVLERHSGDLSVTDEYGTRALGLSELRLGLVADNGVWSFTQAVAGSAVGVGAGAVVARTSPQQAWPPPDTPVEGVFELRVSKLGSWGTWVPPGWRIDGALRASASIGGTFKAPEYTGQVEGTGLAVRNFVEGVNVRDGDVAIQLRGSTARIERFTAKAGNGTLRLSGDAILGEAPKAVLKLEADKFQLLGRVDRRIVASGQAQLELDAKTLKLSGNFGVDEGLIDFTRSDAPSLASDVEVVRARPVTSAASAAAEARASPAPAAPIGRARDVALDLRVALGQALRVRGRGLDTGLRGELRITSPGGVMAVNGTVQAVDGTYAAYGQKLSIDRGQIVFNGPVNNPRLDIEATRPNIDVRVGVAISGTPLNPRVRLFSEPELPETDKLSWLVLGRASDGLGRTDTALLQRAALALLAGEGSSPTDQFIRAIGLDDLSLRQSDGEVRDTVISLGKQLSRNWYVGYERGLNATSGTWQLIYRIARRFTLRAQSGDDNAVDLIWVWRWQ